MRTVNIWLTLAAITNCIIGVNNSTSGEVEAGIGYEREANGSPILPDHFSNKDLLLMATMMLRI